MAKAFTILALFTIFHGPWALAADAKRLPNIKDVGAVPVYWENAEDHDTFIRRFKDKFLAIYYHVLENGRKYKIINNALIAKLWNTDAGRTELKNEFELHAFFSLNVVNQTGLLIMTARLLDPDLKPLIAESESIESRKLFNMKEREIETFLEGLIYRTYNRIPVDVFITSIQGPYVTLSGGMDQNIKNGDKYQIMRHYLGDTHQADQTWINYKEELVGEVEVVDSKQLASVAKIIQQSFPGAIEVGDGTEVSAIRSRFLFENKLKKVPTKIMSSVPQPDGKPQAKTIKPLVKSGKFQDDSPENLSQSNTPPTGPQQPNEIAPPQQESSDESFFSTLGAGTSAIGEGVHKVVDFFVDEITFRAGLSLWSFDKPSTVESQFPIILINNVGAIATRPLYDKFHIEFGGHLMFGKTANGSYNGINGIGRIFWMDSSVLMGNSESKFKAGLEGSFNGLGVTGEKFGGGDVVKSGIFAQLMKELVFDQEHTLDTHFEFGLFPLNIGRFGIGGVNQSVRSSLGWDITMGAFLRGDKDDVIQWGGEFSYASFSYALSNNKDLTSSTTTFTALAKYKF